MQDQHTTLHVASRTGDSDTVELLLKGGANVDAVTSDQYTALHIAAKDGHDDIARVLLSYSVASCKMTTKVFKNNSQSEYYMNKTLEQSKQACCLEELEILTF